MSNISIPMALPGGGSLPSAASAGPGSGAVATPRPDAAVAAALQAAAVSQSQQSNSAQVAQAFEKIKAAVAPMAQNLQFSKDDSSGKTVVRVVDTNTHEVIRQIPSEELLQLAQELDRMQGLLLRGKA